MTTNFSFKVKNFKCFGDKPQGFEKIMPINVIIGKNNSGKSSLIEIIPQIIEHQRSFIEANPKTEIIIIDTLTREIIRNSFPESATGGVLHRFKSHFEYGKKFIDKKISFRLNGIDRTLMGIEIPFEFDSLKADFQRIVESLHNPFINKKYLYVTAERNIVPEPDSHEIEVKPSGEGITSLITAIINNVQYNSRLIQDTLFNELKNIVYPDIELANIIPQRHSNNSWEIFFDTSDGNRIALSKMGSGIKTVLQVLVNLIVLPESKTTELNKCIFVFEELENNLHPAMQRRLLEYLKRFIIENNATLFITTHSNIVIDIFGKDKNSQIVHVQKKEGKTIVSSTNSFSSNKLILKDLDVRASDILQSNGVIWVEGPSDRNYINKWISLIEPDLKEGIHYSILPYGGRVLANFSFDYDYLEQV